ncbi:hypothetical protein [Actinophytocola xanthii]|uniref:hypothetical protein n=1 Tax=Actinophytocola xanthii TaxID=1912961 RepID=UPI0018E975CB|nr:hypothetical protein [Actinophytocola xanthii]
MRNWLTRFKGFNADGRALGLGLAVAMERQREQATHDVEEYLRRNAEDRPVTTTSA